MNILQKIFTGSAIAQLRKLVSEAGATRERLARFAAKSTSADADISAAREKFFATLDAKDFDLWVAAQSRHAAILNCASEISRRAGHLADAELQTPEARDLLLTALRDSATALAREVDALAADEKQRLAASGIEAAGENPALAKLRARVVELRECRTDLEGRDTWGHCLSRYFAALSLN